MNTALHKASQRASNHDNQPRVKLFIDNNRAYLYDEATEACLTSDFVCDVEGWR